MVHPHNVDICVTCVSDKPPQLPLREELPSLGIEVVYNAQGLAARASKQESKKLVKQLRSSDDAKKQKHPRFFSRQNKKKAEQKKEARKQLENKLRVPKALSYQKYGSNLAKNGSTDSSSGSSAGGTNEDSNIGGKAGVAGKNRKDGHQFHRLQQDGMSGNRIDPGKSKRTGWRKYLPGSPRKNSSKNNFKNGNAANNNNNNYGKNKESRITPPASVEFPTSAIQPQQYIKPITVPATKEEAAVVSAFEAFADINPSAVYESRPNDPSNLLPPYEADLSTISSTPVMVQSSTPVPAPAPRKNGDAVSSAVLALDPPPPAPKTQRKSDGKKHASRPITTAPGPTPTPPIPPLQGGDAGHNGMYTTAPGRHTLNMTSLMDLSQEESFTTQGNSDASLSSKDRLPARRKQANVVVPSENNFATGNHNPMVPVRNSAPNTSSRRNEVSNKAHRKGDVDISGIADAMDRIEASNDSSNTRSNSASFNSYTNMNVDLNALADGRNQVVAGPANNTIIINSGNNNSVIDTSKTDAIGRQTGDNVPYTSSSNDKSHSGRQVASLASLGSSYDASTWTTKLEPAGSKSFVHVDTTKAIQEHHLPGLALEEEQRPPSPPSLQQKTSSKDPPGSSRDDEPLSPVGNHADAIHGVEENRFSDDVNPRATGKFQSKVLASDANYSSSSATGASREEAILLHLNGGGGGSGIENSEDVKDSAEPDTSNSTNIGITAAGNATTMKQVSTNVDIQEHTEHDGNSTVNKGTPQSHASNVIFDFKNADARLQKLGVAPEGIATGNDNGNTNVNISNNNSTQVTTQMFEYNVSVPMTSGYEYETTNMTIDMPKSMMETTNTNTNTEHDGSTADDTNGDNSSNQKTDVVQQSPTQHTQQAVREFYDLTEISDDDEIVIDALSASQVTSVVSLEDNPFPIQSPRSDMGDESLGDSNSVGAGNGDHDHGAGTLNQHIDDGNQRQRAADDIAGRPMMPPQPQEGAEQRLPQQRIPAAMEMGATNYSERRDVAAVDHNRNGERPSRAQSANQRHSTPPAAINRIGSDPTTSASPSALSARQNQRYQSPGPLPSSMSNPTHYGSHHQQPNQFQSQKQHMYSHPHPHHHQRPSPLIPDRNLMDDDVTSRSADSKESSDQHAMSFDELREAPTEPTSHHSRDKRPVDADILGLIRTTQDRILRNYQQQELEYEQQQQEQRQQQQNPQPARMVDSASPLRQAMADNVGADPYYRPGVEESKSGTYYEDPNPRVTFDQNVHQMVPATSVPPMPMSTPPALYQADGNPGDSGSADTSTNNSDMHANANLNDADEFRDADEQLQGLNAADVDVPQQQYQQQYQQQHRSNAAGYDAMQSMVTADDFHHNVTRADSHEVIQVSTNTSNDPGEDRIDEEVLGDIFMQQHDRLHGNFDTIDQSIDQKLQHRDSQQHDVHHQMRNSSPEQDTLEYSSSIHPNRDIITSMNYDSYSQSENRDHDRYEVGQGGYSQPRISSDHDDHQYHDERQVNFQHQRGNHAMEPTSSSPSPRPNTVDVNESSQRPAQQHPDAPGVIHIDSGMSGEPRISSIDAADRSGEEETTQLQLDGSPLNPATPQNEARLDLDTPTVKANNDGERHDDDDETQAHIDNLNNFSASPMRSMQQQPMNATAAAKSEAATRPNTDDQPEHMMGHLPVFGFKMNARDTYADIPQLLWEKPSLPHRKLEGVHDQYLIHALCNKELDIPPPGPTKTLTDALISTVDTHLSNIRLVASRNIEACLHADAYNDLPVHLLARRLMEWEGEWYQGVYERAQEEDERKNSNGGTGGTISSAEAVTRLYQGMSQCIDAVLSPIGSNSYLCRRDGSIGVMLPLHVASIFTVPFTTLNAILDGYPAAAGIPCNLEGLNTFIPAECFPLELHDRLSTDFPKWEIENAATTTANDSGNVTSKDKSKLRRSDLLFAYHPGISPYQFDEDRIQRLEEHIVDEVQRVVDKNENGEFHLSRATQRMWVWFCTEGGDLHVPSMERILRELSYRCVLVLASVVDAASGKHVVDVASSTCAVITREHLERLSALHIPVPMEVERIHTSKRLETWEREIISRRQFQGRGFASSVFRTAFNVSEDKFPTSFVLLPYKLVRDRQGRLGLESEHAAQIAMRFADCLIELTSPEFICQLMHKKTQRFHTNGESCNMYTLQTTETRAFQIALEDFLDLYQGDEAYLYLMDEYKGVPIVPNAGDVYPLPVTDAADIVQKVLPLMVGGMLQMRGNKSLSIIAEVIARDTLPAIGECWREAAKDITGFIFSPQTQWTQSFLQELLPQRDDILDVLDDDADAENGKDEENDHIILNRRNHQSAESGVDKLQHMAMRQKKRKCKCDCTARTSTGAWVVELSLLRMLLEMHDPKHTFAGLKLRRKGNQVLWSADLRFLHKTLSDRTYVHYDFKSVEDLRILSSLEAENQNNAAQQGWDDDNEASVTDDDDDNTFDNRSHHSRESYVGSSYDMLFGELSLTKESSDVATSTGASNAVSRNGFHIHNQNNLNQMSAVSEARDDLEEASDQDRAVPATGINNAAAVDEETDNEASERLTLIERLRRLRLEAANRTRNGNRSTDVEVADSSDGAAADGADKKDAKTNALGHSTQPIVIHSVLEPMTETFASEAEPISLLDFDDDFRLDGFLQMRIQLDEQEAKLDFLGEKLSRIHMAEKDLLDDEDKIANMLESAQAKTGALVKASSGTGCGLTEARKLLIRLCDLEDRLLCKEVEVQHLKLDISVFEMEAHTKKMSSTITE